MSDITYTIYKYTSPSGKSYIGQTKNLINRHKWHQDKNSNCRALGYAIKKYGIDAFILEVLEARLTLEVANIREEELIREHNTLSPAGYNLKRGGHNHALLEETKQRISESNKGKHSRPHSDDERKRHSETNKRLGIKPPSQLGRVSPKRGVQMSNEQREKLRKPKTPQKKVSCPHCERVGSEGNMHRHHFDNCKFKEISQPYNGSFVFKSFHV